MNLISRALIKILSLSILERPTIYIWHLYHIARLNSVKNNTLDATFKTVKKEKLDITSDFPKRDAKALESIVQMILKENIKVVEIGSWKGMSTSVLAKTVKPFNGTIFAVDHWAGSDGVPQHTQAKTNDILSTFRYNMKALGVLDIIHPMVMNSKTAASIFVDDSIDMVFIDADHRYSQAKADIEMWYPKLKSGGIICGHDSEEKYTKFGEYKAVVDQHLEEDVIVGICHPGVVKALFDVFGNNYNTEPNSSIWWHKKE